MLTESQSEFLGVTVSELYATLGMPSLRTNPFSTDFYHLFQSTDKKKDLWTNLRIFSYSVRPLPPPPTLSLHFRDSRYSTDKNDLWTNLRIFYYYCLLFQFRIGA